MRALLVGLLMVAFMAANVSCKPSFFTQSFGWSTSGFPMEEFIEVDTDEDVEVFRVKQSNQQNDLLQAVVDFGKSMIGIYMPKDSGCYLIGGIDKAFYIPKDLEAFLKTDASEVKTKTKLNYVLRGDYTVKDRSLLPSKLDAQCKNRSIYWLERGGEQTSNTTSQERSRRNVNMCNNGCFGTGGVSVSVTTINFHGGRNQVHYHG